MLSLVVVVSHASKPSTWEAVVGWIFQHGLQSEFREKPCLRKDKCLHVWVFWLHEYLWTTSVSHAQEARRVHWILWNWHLLKVVNNHLCAENQTRISPAPGHKFLIILATMSVDLLWCPFFL